MNVFICGFLSEHKDTTQSKENMSVNFQLEWMEEEEYRSQLKPNPSYRNKAICKLCLKTFAISTMGEHVLKSHASSKTQQTALRMSQGMDSVSDHFKGKESVAKETEEKSFRRGKTEWGNFTVFRVPIKHNKICPNYKAKQKYCGH